MSAVVMIRHLVSHQQEHGPVDLIEDLIGFASASESHGLHDLRPLHTKPVGMRPSLYSTVGGLTTTTLPGKRSAFKNAAVTSREAIVLNLDEAAQDRMNLNIRVSRSVVVIFPYVSLV